MAHLAFMQRLRERVEETFACFNAGDYDPVLATYVDDVRFSFPVPAKDPSSARPIMFGSGRDAARTALDQLRREYGPLHVTDVFGAFQARSIVASDAQGGQIMFSVEVNGDGLTTLVVGVRTDKTSR